MGKSRRGCVLLSDFDGGDDIRLHPAHYVQLYPFVAHPLRSVFVIEPPFETSRAEAGGVASEILFYGL